MTGLDSSSRNALERLITRARRILEDDLAATAEGHFGIHKNGKVEEEDSLRLSPAEVLDRREVAAVVSHLRLEGASAASAAERLVREATFTHLNRLVAIRIAESIGILPPSLAAGKASRGFRDVLEIAPLMASDQYGGYWFYLRLCADELAADAPLLFDPRNPLLTLAPSPHGLDELVSFLGDPAIAQAWLAPDALGWAYQFFNTGDERREMREAGAPRTSRELAVRNQFFTPRYVVDFLVQNSLGRRLIEGGANPALASDMPLLVDQPVPSGDSLGLEQVRVLDPACGSGHFLLGAYDLLEKAWGHCGVPSAEAAAKILPCLHGIDIDPRCAQVASAALMLRARRACPSGALPHPEVTTARAMPQDDDAWGRVLVELPPERQSLLRTLRDALTEAPMLGSLLKVEEQMRAEIRLVIPESVPDQLWYRPDALGKAELEVLEALDRIADESMSAAAERLLAAEARDAIRFVEAMRRRYDVVLMNPPFGAAVPSSLRTLRETYAGTWTDLYGAFVERGISLLRPRGVLGAITSSQYFTVRTMRALREQLIGQFPTALVDLGGGVLEGATVNVALTVLQRGRAPGMTRYLDLSTGQEEDRPSLLARAVLENGLRQVDCAAFGQMPGLVFALHANPGNVRAFSGKHHLEPDVGLVRTGCHTFDDFQFLRCWWELGSVTDGWRTFEKGGGFRPYLAATPLVVDWRDDGRALKELATAERGTTAQVVQSSRFWDQPGLTYSRMAKAFAARLLPAGEIFSDHSISIFPIVDVDPLNLLALLNSAPVADLLRTMGRGRATENSAVKALPISLVVLIGGKSIGDGIDR